MDEAMSVPDSLLNPPSIPSTVAGMPCRKTNVLYTDVTTWNLRIAGEIALRMSFSITHQRTGFVCTAIPIAFPEILLNC